jgi:hypothetical protein
VTHAEFNQPLNKGLMPTQVRQLSEQRNRQNNEPKRPADQPSGKNGTKRARQPGRRSHSPSRNSSNTC